MTIGGRLRELDRWAARYEPTPTAAWLSLAGLVFFIGVLTVVLAQRGSPSQAILGVLPAGVIVAIQVIRFRHMFRRRR